MFSAMGCSLYKLRLMGVQEDIRRVINCTIRSLVLALPPWYVSYYRFKNPILQMCPNLNLCQERLMGNDQDRLGPTVSIMVNGFWWKDHIYHSLAVLPLIKRSPKRMFGSQNTSLPRVYLKLKCFILFPPQIGLTTKTDNFQSGQFNCNVDTFLMWPW